MSEELNKAIDERIDAKMTEIAEMAAKKALENVYMEIGQGVLRRVAWVIGVGLLVLLSWLAGRGYIKP